MTGIIWYKNRTKGLERFKQLIEEYERVGIATTKKVMSYNFAYAHFENGDYWRLFSTNENNRGAACNVSLIEEGIDRDRINTIIKPCTKAYPYRAINYWS